MRVDEGETSKIFPPPSFRVDGNVIVTPLFTPALRPATAAAALDSLIHHCGRHPSSFLLLTPLQASSLRHLLAIPHALHPTGQSIPPSRYRNPISSRPCVNLTYLSACLSPSSIFNTQLVLRILGYGAAPVFVCPLPWQRRGKTGGIMQAAAAALIESAAPT